MTLLSNMVYDKVIEGKFAILRAVRPEDADFILALRNNKEISKYLPPLRVTVEQQQAWISKQRNDNDSYYFIILDKAEKKLGTISVYNITDRHAEVGRFCSIGESVINMEAALLHNEFVFDILNLAYLDIWVYKGNQPVLSLNQGFGCKWEGESTDERGEPFLFGKLTKENFIKKSIKIKRNLSIINSV